MQGVLCNQMFRRLVGRLTAPARFLSMDADQRLLLLRALWLVLMVRAGLCIVTSRRLHGLLNRSAFVRQAVSVSDARRAARAVEGAARLVPRATCLTRALALQALLRGLGAASAVHVGFARTESGELHGHAWLVWEDTVLTGGGDLSGFRTTHVLEAHTGRHVDRQALGIAARGESESGSETVRGTTR